MLEPVLDKVYPGGLHLIQARPTDANGIPLDVPPGAAAIGETGAPDDAKALAVDAEADRLAAWEAQQTEAAEAQYADEIAAALATSVADLDDYLATISVPAAVEAMAAADTRITAAAHYETRLLELAG